MSIEDAIEKLRVIESIELWQASELFLDKFIRTLSC